jgi:hypothetical protein
MYYQRLAYNLMTVNNVREWVRIQKEVFGKINPTMDAYAVLDKEFKNNSPKYTIYRDLEYYIASSSIVLKYHE